MQKKHGGKRAPTQLALVLGCVLGSISYSSFAVDATGLLGKEIRIETKSDRGQFLWHEDGAEDLRWNGPGDPASDFRVVEGASVGTIALLHLDTGKYLSCLCAGAGQLRPTADDIGDWESYTVVDRGDDDFALVAANDRAVHSAFGSSTNITRAFNWATDPTKWEARYTYELANRAEPEPEDTSEVKGGVLGQTIRLKTMSNRGDYLWIEEGSGDLRWDGAKENNSVFEVVDAGIPDLVALRHLPTGKFLRCLCGSEAPDNSGALVLGSDEVDEWSTFLMTDHGPAQYSLTAANGKAVYSALGSSAKFVRAFSWANNIASWQAQYTYEIVDLTHEDIIFSVSAPSVAEVKYNPYVFVSFDVTEPRMINFELLDQNNVKVFSLAEQVDEQADADFEVPLPDLFTGMYEWRIYMTAIDDTTPIGEVFTQSVNVSGFEYGDIDRDGDIDKNDTKLFKALLKSGETSVSEHDYNGDGVVDKADYSELRNLCTNSKCKVQLTVVEELSKSRDTLSYLIKLMEDDGVNVEKEKMTLHTAELFLDWADWDQANPDILAAHYATSGSIDDDESVRMARWLPGFEREGARDIMQEAIDRLKKMRSEGITRRPASLVDYSQVNVGHQNLYENDKPVFLADYIWKPQSPNFTKYYGDLDGEYIAPTFLNEDGSPKAWAYNSIVDHQEDEIGTVFLSHNVIPSWIKTNYPEIEDGTRIYGKYDIDHPAAKQMFKDLFKHFSPIMKGKKFSELGYMLFNEPSYFTEQGTWNSGIVSQYTLDKYEAWLEEKHGDITTLNNILGTQLSSFDEVNESIPMQRSLQGTPCWMDWMTFNNYRVTDWFAFLNSEIRKYDPEANSHTKLMPWLFADAGRDHGIDFEAITNLNTITSFDASMQNGLDFGSKPWEGVYSFDWQTALITFDFLRSVKPDNIMYDSENHFVNKSNYHNPTLQPDYVRAAYWSGFVGGIDATKTWVWNRNEDGSIFTNRGIDIDMIISMTQNPKVLNEITSTVMDLNSYSEEIVALQHARQPIRIFYSTSAGINSRGYMPKQRDLHESLFFEGEAIGFVTENILASQSVNWDAVVVYQTPVVTQAEFDQLQAYLDQGGTIVIDDASLLTNEYGQAFATSLFASQGQIINAHTLVDVTNAAIGAVNDKDALFPVMLQESVNGVVREVGQKKVFVRQVNMSGDKIVMSVVNAGLDDIEISLVERSDGTRVGFTSMLEGNKHSYMTKLKPFDVKLIEIAR